MIIWINGTFGSGKTTTAYELQRRVEKAFVYDPERFGYVLMANVPKEISKGDFQDYPLWREANYRLLKQVAEEYAGIIIVPMTVTNELYFAEVIGRLRAEGINVLHFTLAASKSTIQKRLWKRWEGKNSWAFQQSHERLKVLESDLFKEHIQTDEMSIGEVVESIAKLSGIELILDHRRGWQKKLDRLAIKLKEIGFLKQMKG
ncbi:AAA family ATPase [Lederbergia galactosidilytica]|uniref:Tunicamycin resistance protein n=1 Tax=Lederbergia galactosidilytica TaxID=217031 RepID=A0A177ZMB7_9BACI|nr:AAA family ATPase [Lederbergia galactosidilytica]KRG14868.1 Tunicamycin resistance protein [Virgibacillus soli]MBP1914545.1 cytidylate kinase [Lederbergia galactosidilytica]OAK69117.1 Tunicamycin resistance protein [Lederbergia galactosidilytica]